MKRKLMILAVVVGLMGALLATAGVASGSVPGSKLDLQANDTQGDRFVLIQGGSSTHTQTLTKQGACGIGSSGPLLVAFSATAYPNNPAPGLKDHIFGVTAQGEGNGTPCSRIDGDASGRNEKLIIELAGPTIGNWYADYAQFGIKLKFGATGTIQALLDGTPVTGLSKTVSCTGGDCGPDSGNDRVLFELGAKSGGGPRFNGVVISVDSPSDGSVSLLDDPAAGFDTYFMLAADNLPPVITVLGDNPTTAEAGESYSDAGATAIDDFDGPVTVTTTGTVDTSVLGVQTVTYSATDSSANTATATRSVTVADTTPPTITLVGGDLEIEANKDFPYVDAGASAVDVVDGAVAVTTSGTVDAGQAGVYTLRYNASDAAGNPAAEVTRTVTVVDTTAPTITLIGDNPLVVLVGDLPYVDAGATATDNSRGPLTIEVNASDVEAINNGASGTYFVDVTATDPSGLTATATREVNVFDGLLACGDTKSESNGDITGTFTRLGVEGVNADCEEIKPYNLIVETDASGGTITFQPEGSVVARYDGTVTFAP